jgi:putative alpha-1,2-mannosidase
MKVIRIPQFLGLYLFYRILLTSGPTAAPNNLRAATPMLNKVRATVGEIRGNWASPSVGNVIPVAARPWGATHWAVANVPGGGDGWWHNGGTGDFAGIRCTNQPSPWVGDYSFFTVRVSGATRAEDLHMSPNHIYLRANNGVTVEVTPWDHGGIIRLSGLADTGLTLDHLDDVELDAPGTLIRGVAKKSSVFHSHFPRWVTIRMSHAVTETRGQIRPKLGHALVMYVGLSYLDSDQADHNANMLWNIGAAPLAEEGAELWEVMLSRAGTTGSPLHYTNMYRAMPFPRFISEFLPNGTHVHRSPYDAGGGIYPGPLVTDSGFWDSYRTVYPFLHQFFPDVVREMYRGWANAIREDPHNMLPQWASPGRVGSMVGAMGEVSMCEGMLEGDVLDPQDSAAIYQYLVRSVTDPDVPNGRAHLRDYLDLGYVPSRHGESVSLTLNYMLADYVVGRCAALLGDHELSADLIDRSKRWHTIWDPESKFFRPKTREGNWHHALDPYEWMGDYTEGGPWQYRFYVPHDIPGLASAWGGADSLCDAMLEMMTAPNTVSNRRKIHEELEMQQHVWGQYAHNNQVVHHFLPMMKKLSPRCAKLADPWIDRVLTELYTVGGYSGDEDNGEMAAWYILMTVGDYPVVPGVKI